MTLLQTLHARPSKAIDLFTKLADTTPGAVKTRQSLFSELKSELELLAAMERDHLLPVLRKHAGTKEIAPPITERLRVMRTLLARMDKEPMEGDDFAARVAELRTLFRAHLRDEKNELLPAIKKALSDEEAAKVAEKMEADRLEAEQAELAAAEARRVEARRQREKLEADKAKAIAAEAARLERERQVEAEAARAAKAAAADAHSKAAAKARDAKAAAEAAQQEAEANAKLEAARARRRARAQEVRTEKEAAEAIDMTAMVPAPSGASQQRIPQGVSEPLNLVASRGAGARLLQAPIAGARAWIGLTEARTQNMRSALAELRQCRTPFDLVALQARVVRQDIDLMVDAGRSLSGIAARTEPSRAAG